MIPGLRVGFHVGGCASDECRGSRGGNLGGKTNIIIDEHQTNDQRNPWFIYSHRSALEVGERAFRVWWRDSLGRKTSE